MTPLQKEIVAKMFDGATIAAYGNDFRLRDNKHNPILRFTYKTFRPISSLLRKGNGVFVLDKTVVRSLHGRSWVKQYYKSLKNRK